MLKKRILAAALCCVLLLCSCGNAEKTEKNAKSVFAMDTYMTVTAYGADDDLLSEAIDEIKNLESELSVTDETSEIYCLNHTGSVQASEETCDVLQKALELCAETDGALDITVYPVLRAWGFTTGDYKVPASSQLQKLLQYVDYNNVSMDSGTVSVPEGTEVDLGSVAKGYTADRVADILKAGGVTSAILDLGGNIQCVGTKPDGRPWKVAVRSPEGDEIMGVISADNEAVVTSGGYERYFEDEDGNLWWHIINPSTGCPAQNGLISVTVVGEIGVECDALSTALFVMGPDKAISYWKEHGDFEMLLVTENGELIITPELYERFEPDDGLSYEIKVLEYAED